MSPQNPLWDLRPAPPTLWLSPRKFGEPHIWWSAYLARTYPLPSLSILGPPESPLPPLARLTMAPEGLALPVPGFAATSIAAALRDKQETRD